MLKRSKSKEPTANGNGGMQTGQRNANQVLHGNNSSASKSIFNASYKELKPSKSVDLTASMAAATGSHADGPSSNLMATTEDESDSYELFYMFKPQEKVLQVACGSIHSLIRTNMNRLFSCGNGSTYALGHASRESCSTFRLIEYFNGPP